MRYSIDIGDVFNVTFITNCCLLVVGVRLNNMTSGSMPLWMWEEIKALG